MFTMRNVRTLPLIYRHEQDLESRGPTVNSVVARKGYVDAISSLREQDVVEFGRQFAQQPLKKSFGQGSENRG